MIPSPSFFEYYKNITPKDCKIKPNKTKVNFLKPKQYFKIRF